MIGRKSNSVLDRKWIEKPKLEMEEEIKSEVKLRDFL